MIDCIKRMAITEEEKTVLRAKVFCVLLYALNAKNLRLKCD